MKLLVLCALLCVLSVAFCEYSQCVIDTPDGTINLNGAASPDGFYDVPDNSAPWTYMVNICEQSKGFKGYDDCKNEYGGSKAYQRALAPGMTGSYGCYPMSESNSQGAEISLSLVNPSDSKGGVVLKYREFNFDNYKRTTTFTISCDPTATQTSLLFDVEDYTEQNSKYKFTGKSKHACPGGSPYVPSPSENLPLGHYGVGGLLMTLGFVALLLYFTIGFCLNKFKLKPEASIVEQIPNVEFWKAIPFLLKDGVMLFVDIYHQIRGNKNYQNIDNI
jgi:hypothetical protein